MRHLLFRRQVLNWEYLLSIPSLLVRLLVTVANDIPKTYRARDFGNFGDFCVSFVATVAGRYTRWGGTRLSVQGEPLIVLTRGP